jgi:hypothetical protein
MASDKQVIINCLGWLTLLLCCENIVFVMLLYVYGVICPNLEI